MNQIIFLAGINHNSANQDLREKFALPLGTKGLLICAEEMLGICELAVLSTCNREELVLVCEAESFLGIAGENASEHIIAFWAKITGQNQKELQKYIYCYKNRAAVNHLFQVASSLDSMLPGEPQILGQVKKAYARAVKEGTSKVILNKLFHKSFYTAKRVLSQTKIAASPVSVVFTALDLLKTKLALSDSSVEIAAQPCGQPCTHPCANPCGHLHDQMHEPQCHASGQPQRQLQFQPQRQDDLCNKKILILGAGETAELACKYLRDAQVKNIIIANRTLANAQKLANRFAGQVCGLAELEQVLPQVDIVLGTATRDKPLITSRMVLKAVAIKRGAPFFIIDIALPRNFETHVRGLNGVEFYDLDDLQEMVEKNKQNRQNELQKALPIVEEETDNFMLWLNSLALEPTIVDLLARTQAIADDELTKTLKKIGPLDTQTVKALEAMLKAVVKKINHEPITFIKHVQQKHGNIARYIDILRNFFSLDKKD